MHAFTGHSISPYEHFVIDIETANAEPTEVERWARECWSPDHRWHANTIGERYQEARSKKLEKLALLDASPIISIAIRTERDMRCLHAMRVQGPDYLAGALVEGFAESRLMLLALRNLLEAACDEATVLIGHNVTRFDLAKLRHAFVTHGLRIPAPLVNRDQPIFDTMAEFCRFFSLDRELFISIAELGDRFGMAHHKGILQAAVIPEFFAAGRFDEIVAYNLADAALEYDVFCRMVGITQDEASAPSATPSVDGATTAQAPTPALARKEFTLDF